MMVFKDELVKLKNQVQANYVEDIMEVKMTMPFIKMHLTKLQLKLEIQREAMNKN